MLLSLYEPVQPTPGSLESGQPTDKQRCYYVAYQSTEYLKSIGFNSIKLWQCTDFTFFAELSRDQYQVAVTCLNDAYQDFLIQANKKYPTSFPMAMMPEERPGVTLIHDHSQKYGFYFSEANMMHIASTGFDDYLKGAPVNLEMTEHPLVNKMSGSINDMLGSGKIKGSSPKFGHQKP